MSNNSNSTTIEKLKTDNPKMLQTLKSAGNLKNLENEFNIMRNKFEKIYSKTRILNKPKDYVLDQDHHHHPANQTVNFDWQFLSEIMLLKKIKETYKI